MLFSIHENEGERPMGKISLGREAELSMMEMVMALRENTNVLNQSIKEVRKLSGLLVPTLKESELLKLKLSEDKTLLHDCIKTIRNSDG